MARGFDSAAAQFADLDPQSYCLFVEECLNSWYEDETGNKTLGTHLRRATQPLRPQPRKAESSVRRNVSAAHLQERERREQKRRENRTADTICPHCKSVEHTTTEFEVQERSADEGATPYRRCENPDCTGKPWRVRENAVKEKKTKKKKKKEKEKKH